MHLQCTPQSSLIISADITMQCMQFTDDARLVYVHDDSDHLDTHARGSATIKSFGLASLF